MTCRRACVPVAVALLAAAWCGGCAKPQPGPGTATRPGGPAAAPALPRQIRSAKDGSVGLLVPAGEFQMGEGEQQKRVTLEAFYIDRTEVTNGQYAQFLAAVAKAGNDAQWRHPEQPVSKRDHEPRFWEDPNLGKAKGKHPVVGVDWFDAYAYANWAGRRLPTAAEWERAARGTDGRIYPWGNEPPRRGLAFRASYFGAYAAADGHAFTAPAGSFASGASPVGCLNLAGNAAEWVADWFGLPPDARRLDSPTGPATGTHRVIKGGSWNTGVPTLRTFAVLASDPAQRHANVGFRCCADAPAEGQ